MIVFDPKKVTYENVFINNVGRNTIRIEADGDSEPYRNQFGLKGRYVKKSGEFVLQVHQSVTTSFLSVYKTKHFKTRKACIFVYEGEVLFIDCGYESYSLIDGVFCVDRRFGESVSYDNGWKSSNIEAMDKIGEIIESRGKDGSCLLDGSNLIIRKKDANSVGFMGDERIRIEEVYFLDLSKMVRATSNIYMRNIVKRYTSKLNLGGETVKSEEEPILSNDEKKAAEEKEKKDSSINDLFNLKNGLVFTFNYGDNGEETGISPLINNSRAVKSVEGAYDIRLPLDFHSQVRLFTNSKVSSSETLDFKTNLHYVITVAKVVARHYGYDKTDFLNIPEVIESVGTINLVSDIEFNDRLQAVVGIDPMNAISFISGFAHRETRLNVLRDLRTVFSSIINYGFFYGKISTVSSLSEEDIPLSGVDVINAQFEDKKSKFTKEIDSVMNGEFVTEMA